MRKQWINWKYSFSSFYENLKVMTKLKVRLIEYRHDGYPFCQRAGPHKKEEREWPPEAAEKYGSQESTRRNSTMMSTLLWVPSSIYYLTLPFCANNHHG